MAKASKRSVGVKSTVGGAIEQFFSVVEELRDECQEVVDNASGTNFENSARIETLGETASTLDDVAGNNGNLDLDDVLSDIELVYYEDQRRNLSRASRMGNAAAAADAAVSELRAWAENNEDSEDEDVKARVEAANSAADELEGWKDEAEGVEFPGMYG